MGRQRSAWVPGRLLLRKNLQHSANLYSGCLTMRGFVAVLTFSVFLVQPALAQGIKDPPNYPLPNAQNPRKTQAIQDPSRLNPIRSAPTGSLPAGIAVQGGKLVAVPRY